MKSISDLRKHFTIEKTRLSLIGLLLVLALAFGGAQIVCSQNDSNVQSTVSENNQDGVSVHVHSGKNTKGQRAADLDSTINNLRGSASKYSLPSSMFEPWWQTMLHDPDARWILKNFDVMSSDLDRDWIFPVGLGAYIPRIDTTESDNAIKISAEVPGIDENNLDVAVTDDSVTIKGDKKEEAQRAEAKNEGGLQTIERSYGSFERIISLPCKVASEKAQAVLKNGVLTITIPKSQVAQSEGKKVSIRHEL